MLRLRIAALALGVLTLGLAGCGSLRDAIPSPTPTLTPSLSSSPNPTPRVIPGPYLSEASAESAAQALAAEMGSGSTRIVSATLETFGDASQVSGSVGDTVSPERMVWMVWLQGPYRLFSCPQSPCPAWSNRLYYDVIDATTGALVETGTSGAASTT